MRAVSYTRTTSCYLGEDDYPANVIAIQNDHIRKYAKDHQWKLVDRYSDRKKDKKENTDFEQLLMDGIQRKFDIVVVYSIFRAGKDLWNAKEVLLQTFHYAGIAFAVVEDDFISLGKTNEEAETYFAEKYKMFRKDHIKYQVKERNRKGLLSWNDLAYGYQLTEDHQGIVVDAKTAPVIKRIFSMYAAGIPAAVIAQALEAEKVLTPKAAKGTKAEVKNLYHWSALTINRLVKKTVYAGYWTKTVHGVSHEYTNEPIINKALFDKVQRLAAENDSKSVPRKISGHNRYAGLVCDSQKGFCLHFRRIKNGLEYFVYEKDQRKLGGDKHVLVSDIDQAVRKELNQQRMLAEKILVKIRNDGAEIAADLIEEMRKEYLTYAMMIADDERKRMEHFHQNRGPLTEYAENTDESGVLTSTMTYESFFTEYPEKVQHIERVYSEENPWLKLMLAWKSDDPLDKDVLRKYVFRIVIDQLTTISVELKEQQWLMALPREWRE